MPLDARFDTNLPGESDEHSALLDETSVAHLTPRRSRERRDARSWLESSRTTRRWNTDLIAWTAVSLGVGVLASLSASLLLPAATASIVGPLALWAGMVVPIVIAIRRGRPTGLFAFRATDILWGVALGLLLRTVQGWLAVAAGDSGALPGYPTLDGQLPALWWLTAIVLPVAVAPLVEEVLFRGVILVAVYRIARRGLEGAVLAVIASTAVFVALHAVSGMARWDEPFVLALVGIACGVVVMSTGRIWGAVLVHVVFNGSWVVLSLAGTLLG
ncbi:CPBP family intramembrane glutamic endopeptidase [Microbacterium gilvum]|uniref:CAAX prenyl protease 2/Lysostaphin resistance protein A-like domain-containing protein n=1 Tax=Microbacterium gilvum TaxID=1336204 RepID=A0ABP9ABV8_9MICO